MTMKLVPSNEKVTIQWFVYAGDEKIRHNATMRGAWGYDVTCSCGWETKTGGGVRSWLRHEVELHKFYSHDYVWYNTNSEIGMEEFNK